MLIIRKVLGDLREIIYLCSIVINLGLQNMTKIEQLLKDLQTGSEEVRERVEYFIRCTLKDRELKVFREILGIGCIKRGRHNIGEEMGMTVEEIDSLFKKSLAKLEYLMTEFPDYINWEEDQEENKPDYNAMLKDYPAFIRLKREARNPAPLGQYAQCTLAQFIYDYNNKGLKGKKIFDNLMMELAPEYVEDTSEGTIDKHVEEPLNTVFPSSFDKSELLGEAYKRTISEMISYLEKTSYIPKNQKRYIISDSYFNKHLSPKEIAEKENISITTITTNFLNILFSEGRVDDFSFSQEFVEAANNYSKSIFYKSLQAVKDEVCLNDKDLLCFLSLFGADMYEKEEYHQKPIVIHKGDIIRVNECLFRVFDVLSDAILPISRQQLITTLKDVIDADRWLPEYIDYLLAENDSILKDSAGLIYLSDDMLKTVTSRVCRIIYKSPSHTATKNDIFAEYSKLYGKTPSDLNRKEMEGKQFYNISDGVYQYFPDQVRPINAHNFIDDYIASQVLFKWSDLLEKIKQINPQLKERSERAYTTKKCTICASDSNILVLKGHEDDYPQYKWKGERKMDKTNFFINQAVEILKAQPNSEMTYKAFLSQLNGIILKAGYSDHTTGTVIKNFTYEDPKLFIRENDNIKLDENVLTDVALDYIGLGYKYSDFYLGIYALAVSELKSKSDHKMLRSELTSLAISRISDEIDGKIVNKAFTDRAKPAFLFVDGIGKNVYICLDMAKLATETSADKQYKVATDDNNNQTDSTPAMVIDTTPRQDITYRQMFNWPDIVSMLKKDLRHYDKPFFFQGISSDETVEKFHKFMSQSRNVYLNELIPQAYYELCFATVDRWSSYDYRSKIARAFESLLMDIYYQNRGVESQTKGLREIMDLAFPDYLKARKSYDRSGFNGILNDIYNDRINFAHPITSEMPTLLSNIKAFISYMALYVYTVAKYYKG